MGKYINVVNGDMYILGMSVPKALLGCLVIACIQVAIGDIKGALLTATAGFGIQKAGDSVEGIGKAIGSVLSKQISK
jgi:hypothetical protein